MVEQLNKIVANLPVSLSAKEFCKSVNIWESYGQDFSDLFFDSRCRTYFQIETVVQLKLLTELIRLPTPLSIAPFILQPIICYVKPTSRSRWMPSRVDQLQLWCNSFYYWHYRPTLNTCSMRSMVYVTVGVRQRVCPYIPSEYLNI